MSEQKISREQIQSVLDSYPRERRYALAVMQDVQRLFGYVPRESLEALALHIDCPVAAMYSMATFYKALSMKPKGKHVIKVCDGTACHIGGSVNLINSIQRTLGIGPGDTTGDGLFSLELVNCVGSCALAPVMIVDETYYAQVTTDKLAAILDAYRPGGERDKERTTSPPEAAAPPESADWEGGNGE